MNCQLLSPTRSSKSLQFGIAISKQPYGAANTLNFNFYIENWQLAMKEDNFPEIPQEELPQTHSMYEQLRRTSQKWFTRSHKRIFDDKSQYISQDSSKIGHSQPPIDNHQHKGFSTQQQKARLIELMREQIEICCRQYSAKMRSLLQDQAKKIKVLGDLLVNNQRQLNEKTRIIQHIASSLKGFQETKPSDNRGQYKECQKRAHDLELRLAEIQSVIHRWNSNQKITGIEARFKAALSHISQNYLCRLNEVRQELQDKLDRADKLSHLNMSTTRGVRTSLIVTKQNQNLQKKLAFLQQDLQELRIEVESLQKKTYTYDNYKLNQTQQKLAQMSRIVAKLQNDKNKYGEDHFTSKIGWKGSQTTQLTYTEVNNLVKSSSKSRFINRYKSMISNRKQREEESSQSEHSNESEVEETMVEDEENNVQRFLRVLAETRTARPVLIEVDQTGYAKSVQTGMYLVDSTGNGFEFTLSQMEHLRCRGAIQIA